MLATRRTAVRSTRHLLRRQPLRHESSSSSHASSAGKHGPIPHAHHPEPVNESLGKGFYITLTLLPLTFAIYKFSHSTSTTTTTSSSSQQPLLTRIINSYANYKERWTARNTLHTSMIEQAAHDRNLFFNSRPSAHVELKFPEIFNTGSPWNIPAGQGGANLDKLIAHYEKKNVEAEERKVKTLREGKKEPDPDEIVRRGTY
ncbi:MAG: hypothetical protein M1830_006311 [Pleopsidium flavum]|nr:MAG: hypothetical protein M1830_006311 [Pleopsidium flavum]